MREEELESSSREIEHSFESLISWNRRASDKAQPKGLNRPSTRSRPSEKRLKISQR